jgi:hypothetical protein
MTEDSITLLLIVLWDSDTLNYKNFNKNHELNIIVQTKYL